MAKKRKTRQEKIILQLKKQLAQTSKSQDTPKGTEKPSIFLEPKKQEKPKEELTLNLKNVQINRSDKYTTVSLSYDKSYIYKDLLKTGTLSVLAIAIELVLYLALNFRK